MAALPADRYRRAQAHRAVLHKHDSLGTGKTTNFMISVDFPVRGEFEDNNDRVSISCVESIVNLKMESFAVGAGNLIVRIFHVAKKTAPECRVNNNIIM
jgi:hypothetical protein